MALKADDKQAPAGSVRPGAPSPTAPTEWSLWATIGAVAAWLLLLLGQRVLDADESLAKGLTILAVLGVLATFGLRILVLLRSTPDRKSAARAFLALSGTGVAALAGYFTTTEWGRELLRISKPQIGEADDFGEIALIVWVTLLVISVLGTVLAELAQRPMARAERIESRRIIFAAVAGTAMAAAAAYGSLFTYTAGKLDISADFSFFRTAKPSDTTRKMIGALHDSLQIMLFFPQVNEVGKEVEHYVRDLTKGSDKVEIHVYDRLMVPDIAKEHKVRKDGVIVLSREKMSQTIELDADMKKAKPRLKELDGEFQKALIKVLRDRRTIYLTVGHGELNEAKDARTGRSGRALRDVLERQHYRIKNLGMKEGLAQQVPDDADIVMALGPTEAFLPDEVESLKQYAEGGGRLLLALDPEAKVDLDPLAAIVGLKWDPAVVVNDQVRFPRRRNSSDKGNLVTARFSSHPSVSTAPKVAARGYVAMILGGAPLDKRADAPKDLKVDFTVKSPPRSYVDRNGDFSFDKEGERRRIYNLVAAVTRPVDLPPAEEEGEPPAEPDAGKAGKAGKKDKKADMGPPEMRAVVFGDADAVSDFAFAHPQLLNVLLFAEAVRWLGGEESFSGEISTTKDVTIVHTRKEDQIYFYTTIIGLPSVVLGLGLFFTRRRPKKKKKRLSRGGPGGARKKRTKRIRTASSEKKSEAATERADEVESDAPAEEEATPPEQAAEPDEPDGEDEPEPPAEDESAADSDDDEPGDPPATTTSTMAESPAAKEAVREALAVAKQVRAEAKQRQDDDED